MIREADERVVEWAGQVVDAGQVVLGPPSMDAGVRLHLLEINLQPTTRGAKHSRVNLSLRYIVTASSQPAEKAHQMLEDLLLSAMECPDFEVEWDPPSVVLWQAFGVPPQPCFAIKVQATREIPMRPVKMVRKAVFDARTVTAFSGVVLGPQAIPIPEALVELPALNVSCRTDVHGNFSFPMVPASSLGTLLVCAKGREKAVNLGSGPVVSPLTVELELED